MTIRACYKNDVDDTDSEIERSSKLLLIVIFLSLLCTVFILFYFIFVLLFSDGLLIFFVE